MISQTPCSPRLTRTHQRERRGRLADEPLVQRQQLDRLSQPIIANATGDELQLSQLIATADALAFHRFQVLADFLPLRFEMSEMWQILKANHAQRVFPAEDDLVELTDDRLGVTLVRVIEPRHGRPEVGAHVCPEILGFLADFHRLLLVLTSLVCPENPEQSEKIHDHPPLSLFFSNLETRFDLHFIASQTNQSKIKISN